MLPETIGQLIIEAMRVFQLIYKDIPEATRAQQWADFYKWLDGLKAMVKPA